MYSFSIILCFFILNKYFKAKKSGGCRIALLPPGVTSGSSSAAWSTEHEARKDAEARCQHGRNLPHSDPGQAARAHDRKPGSFLPGVH